MLSSGIEPGALKIRGEDDSEYATEKLKSLLSYEAYNNIEKLFII